jgi:hypothetical protein
LAQKLFFFFSTKLVEAQSNNLAQSLVEAQSNSTISTKLLAPSLARAPSNHAFILAQSLVEAQSNSTFDLAQSLARAQSNHALYFFFLAQSLSSFSASSFFPRDLE